MSPGIEFTGRERKIVLSHDICRFSTNERNGWPHCVPVSYVYSRGRFYLPVTNNSRKAKNARRDNRTSVVIDDEKTESGLMIRCYASVVEGQRLSKLKTWMRKMTGWEIGDSKEIVILELIPVRKSSWFLKS